MYEQLIEEFIYECRIRNYSQRTLKGYKNNNLYLFRYIKSEFSITDVKQVTRKQIKLFIDYQLKKGCKASYVNSTIKSYRAFFKYLKQEEYIEISPIDNMPLLKDKKTVIKTFTNKDIKAILKNTSDKSYIDIRNKLIISMLLDTGIRCTESCILPISAIGDGYILILGKGNKERIVPCSVVLNKLIIRYLRYREEYFKYKDIPDNLFLSRTGRPLTVEAVEYIIKQICDKANIKNIRCSPHTFRHYYAQQMLKNGTDVYSLSRLLGHSNINITQVYLNDLNDTYTQSLINLIEQYNLNRFDVDEVKPISKPAIKKTNEQIADEIWNKNNWGTGDVRRKKLSDAGYDYEIIQNIIETKYCGKKTAIVKTPVKASSPKPVVKPISKTVQQLAKEVIHGDWGNGNIRKQRLEKAGYNYEAVQTEVNKFYK